MSYKLTHPNGDQMEAAAEYVEMYESQGWETAPTAKPPAKSDDK